MTDGRASMARKQRRAVANSACSSSRPTRSDGRSSSAIRRSSASSSSTLAASTCSKRRCTSVPARRELSAPPALTGTAGPPGSEVAARRPRTTVSPIRPKSVRPPAVAAATMARPGTTSRHTASTCRPDGAAHSSRVASVVAACPISSTKDAGRTSARLPRAGRNRSPLVTAEKYRRSRARVTAT